MCFPGWPVLWSQGDTPSSPPLPLVAHCLQEERGSSAAPCRWASAGDERQSRSVKCRRCIQEDPRAFPHCAFRNKNWPKQELRFLVHVPPTWNGCSQSHSSKRWHHFSSAQHLDTLRPKWKKSLNFVSLSKRSLTNFVVIWIVTSCVFIIFLLILYVSLCICSLECYFLVQCGYISITYFNTY